MKPEDLKKIVEIMNENDLAELEIEEEGKRLRLKKAVAPAAPMVAAVAPTFVPAPVAVPAPAGEHPPADAGGVDRGHTITAPMVGTYYSAASPDADPYVEIGQKVGPETVVCILEAMKVMNEIKAECAGTVVKICVQNAEAVEYGQAILVVDPS